MCRVHRITVQLDPRRSLLWTSDMLRHSTGYALAARGMDTRRLQHYLGHASITNTVRYTAMSPEPFKDIWR